MNAHELLEEIRKHPTWVIGLSGIPSEPILFSGDMNHPEDYPPKGIQDAVKYHRDELVTLLHDEELARIERFNAALGPDVDLP